MLQKTVKDIWLQYKLNFAIKLEKCSPHYHSFFLSASETTLSVFAVTSKSMTVQWSSHSGASSYKITATPKNSPERPVFAQFGGNTVMGSINSLSPNTVYTMQLEAMDNAFNVLSSAQLEETTGKDKDCKRTSV